MACPDPIEIEAYLAGQLEPDDSERVREHLATCPVCRDQTDEVSENLELISRAKHLLRRPAGNALHPERVGPFRIVREIGRGGMGIVYLAQQEHPRRRVALKVVRPGLATPGTLRRFEREADALARLEHPNIARIFETGVARVDDPSGWSEPRPWFAMEYSEGVRLDEWTGRHDPTTRERVELLTDVADAIHHAHVNGVVHRDLKPGNILVEIGAGRPRPKVLDFGIARTVDTDLATQSLQTEVGKVLGTIPFMSPEQVVGDPSRINAKTDIYSIGVLAYWLLSGDLPYAVRECSLPEAARIIHEEEPRSLAAAAPRLAIDLGTIVHKCLEKDPERRYASAAAIADDFRRFLSDEPIAARPPSAAYTFQKFVRRNRMLVAVLSLLAVGTVGAAITGTSLALRARRAEREAQQNLSQAEAINQFLLGMLGSANPELAGDRETTVREVLDNAADELATGRLADHPKTEASLRQMLGNTYGMLGRYEEGEAQLRAALAIVERPDVDEDPFTLLNDLGLLIKDVRKYEESESLFMAAQAVAEARGNASLVVTALSNAAASRIDQGDYAGGESLLVRAIDAEPEGDGANEGRRTSNLNNLGVLRHRRGDHAAAEVALRQSLAAAIAFHGKEHPATLATKSNLGDTLRDLDRLAESESMLRDALEGTRRVLGEQHVRTAVCLSRLAETVQRQGRDDEALGLYRESLAVFEEIDPEDARATETRDAIATLTGAR